MQRETLSKLRQYINAAAAHSSLSIAFPLGRWPEQEADLKQIWQEFIEAVKTEETIDRSWQEFVEVAIAELGGPS